MYSLDATLIYTPLFLMVLLKSRLTGNQNLIKHEVVVVTPIRVFGKVAVLCCLCTPVSPFHILDLYIWTDCTVCESGLSVLIKFSELVFYLQYQLIFFLLLLST